MQIFIRDLFDLSKTLNVDFVELIACTIEQYGAAYGFVDGRLVKLIFTSKGD